MADSRPAAQEGIPPFGSAPGGVTPATNREAVLPALFLLLALAVAAETWWAVTLRNRENAFRERVRRQVLDLAAQTEPAIFLRQRLLGIIGRWREASAEGSPAAGKVDGSPAGRPLPRLDLLGRWASRRWGLPLSLYAFDRQGRLTGTWPSPAPNLHAIRRLYPLLAGLGAPPTPDLERQMTRQVRFLFGDEKDLPQLRAAQGRLLETFAGGETGSLAWTVGPAGGIFLHLPRNPSAAEVFRQVVRAGGSGLAAAVLGGPDQAGFLLADGTPAPLATRARAELQAGAAYAGAVGERWWVFQEGLAGRVVGAGFPRPEPPSPWTRTAWWGTAALAAFLLWRRAAAPVDVLAGFPLRRVLTLLFAAAGLVPLVGLLLLSVDLVRQTALVTATRLSTAQQDALQGLARDFDLFRRERARWLEAWVDALGPDPDDRAVARFVAGLRRRGLLGRYSLCDGAGQQLFGNWGRLTPDQAALHISLARRAVELYAPARAAATPYRGNAVSDRAVTAEGLGLHDLLRSPGSLHLVQTGQDRYLRFMRILPGTGRLAYVEVRVPLDQAVHVYLRERTRRRAVYQDLGLRFAAFDPATARWVIPPPPGLDRPFRRLAGRAATTGQAHAGRFRWRGGGGFVTVLANSRLADTCLAALCSDDLLERRRLEGWASLGWSAFVVISLALLIGRALAVHLIVPLGDLEAGAGALRQRQFGFRVRSQRTDELGRLFEAFNGMMEGSQDLQVARRVQEGLIPRRFPQPPGYSLAGRVTMANDLGGDILNCLELPDGRVAFLVGDVSGHGIGSALLMAFARAVTFHWSQRPSPGPASLADDLDRTLRTQAGVRSFMGVVCGLLDPHTHDLTVAVHGHVYPLLVRATGDTAWIGRPAFPLGIGRPRERGPEATVLRLGPGDGLLCVTDGFVESRNLAGHQVGYDRLAAWATAGVANAGMAAAGSAVAGSAAAGSAAVGSAAAGSAAAGSSAVGSAAAGGAVAGVAEAWLADLERRQDAWADAPREDDVTLFAVRRLPENLP